MKQFKKPILIAIVLFMVFAFWKLSGIGGDAQSLGAQIDSFRAWQASNALMFAAVFFIAYLLSSAFSLPIAVPMVLAAGALFGFWQGVFIGSFASTIGATLAFLASRFFLRENVEKRFPQMFHKVNQGVERDGAFYLFTLRLIPVFPFFAINLLMGLTKMRTGVFYLVSQIGMLPGTMAYIYAGTQLATLNSFSDILSPRLIVAFAILGLLPWIAKLILGIWKSRKVYAKWDKPKSFDRNMVVIGAGAAGLVSAYIAAAVKAKVTMIEAGKMGGDCLNYGCVPSKALIASAKAAYGIEHANDFGIDAGAPEVNFPKVMARVQDVIKNIEPHDSIERYEGLGVEVKTGYANIVDPWRVEVNGETLTTKSIIIATGAAPFVPPIVGLETTGYLTSDTLWDHLGTLKEAPKRLTILGGGPIGSELAQAMARLGSKVTLIELADRLMPREDHDVSRALQDALEASGVTVLTGHKATRFTKTHVECETSSGNVKLQTGTLLLALGRAARLDGFGLEELGIPTSRTVETNEYLATLYPNIFAAGDVAGPYQFTHTASHQAWFASVNALFGRFKKFKVDYRVIPWAIFTDPEIARVGISENEAKAQGIAYDITQYDLDDLDRAIADGTTQGFVKVITAKGSDRILGAVVVGAKAGELIHEFVLAMRHNLGLNKVLGTIHIYPTMMEAGKATAGRWKQAGTNPRIMSILEKFHGWMRK